MNKKLMIVTMIFFTLNMCHILQGEKEKYVIGAWTAGFFSSFLAAMNHLQWCSDHNKIPVIYWDKQSFYYSPEYENNSKNVWEYYFEPVSHLKYVEGDPIHWNYYWVNESFMYNCYFIYWIDTLKREKAYKLIAKYIRVKQHIMDKVESFYQQHIKGKKTIGVHLRGTDKPTEEKAVPIQQIFDAINAYDGYQIFVATDEERLLKEAQKNLKGHVIYYDCYRSPDDKPLHIKGKPAAAQLGQDVLIEALLLAQCDKLFHTYSNVSTAVLYFNPYLEHVLFTA